MTKALYLSGGGARSAYQVGVLKGIQEVMQFSGKLPVDILSCVSAGAINGSMLAMHADNFPKAVLELESLWLNLKCSDIFKDSNSAILKSVARNLSGLFVKNKTGGYLFDTAPLASLLEKNLDFKRINHMVNKGYFKAFEVAANCYDLSETVSFLHSHNQFISWRRVRHISYQTDIRAEHILASSAIPLFFPAINIGVLHYGDGTMRLSAPLRGAIKLGAEKIFIISTRAPGKPHDLIAGRVKEYVAFGRILGSMMNALFLDNLDRDLEMLDNLNQRLKLGKITSNHWHYIQTAHISPSADLGCYAKDYEFKVTYLLRYLMRLLGSRDQTGDFLSFLLFDGEYAGKLIDIGYKDTINNPKKIIDFFK